MFLRVCFFLLFAAPLMAADSNVPPAKWTSREPWRHKLRSGMTPQNVRTLLGAPLYEDKASYEMKWFYQTCPVVTPCRVTDMANLEKRSLDYPTYGYVQFTNRNQTAAYNAPFDTKSEPRPQRPLYVVDIWKEPDWTRLASPLPGEVKAAPPQKLARKMENYENRVLWQRLAVGMTTAAVRNILGEPRNEDMRRNNRYWYYTDIQYHGRAVFAPAKDNDNKWYLVQWSEPFWPDIEASLYKSAGTVQSEDVTAAGEKPATTPANQPSDKTGHKTPVSEPNDKGGRRPPK